MRLSGICGKFVAFAVFILLLSLSSGCSNGDYQPLTGPDNNVQEMTADFQDGHNILGYYNLVFDRENMTVEVFMDHTASIHFNVVPFFFNTAPHAINFKLFGYNPDEHIYTIEVSVKNPTFRTGYDVKGIICLDGTGEYDLRNPDVYTELWSPMVSPFIYFAKSAPNYQFPPSSVYTEIFRIYISEDHLPTFAIPFAIDAHWPGVQEDPIWISNITINNNSANVTIECDVIDAQDNIERVWADTIAFTGSETDFTYLSGNRYRAVFPIGVAPGGLNRVLLSAKSEGTDVLLHHYAEVFIAGGAVLEGEVFNAITLQKAANTKVFVTNVVSGGFEPLPAVIGPDGQYFYNMEAGDYNIRVTTNTSVIQYDMMDTIYAVTINPDDHIVVDFGLGPEWLDDNNEQICCINGQVFDSNTGEPIAFAQLSIDGGAQTGGVFQNRVTDSRGHYVFWKVPVNDNDENPIEEFIISCVADFYIPAKRTAVPFGWNKNTPQENFYLVPFGSDCYWEDGLEDGGLPGWEFKLIDCTQMWQMHEDFELYNENVTKICDDGGPTVELPPGDTSNGRVWEPWEGEWSLWYGEDDDGSFIHDWSILLEPGGTSICPHSARAISPVIDITTLNQATITWKQIWEIEGVDPSFGFDSMRAYVKDATTDDWFLFEHSNPLTEPVPDLEDGNAKHPQTSGGFDIPPVWQAVVHNLGDLDDPDTEIVEHMDFTGMEIQFSFKFATVDDLYNGFRGWLLDDFCLYPMGF